MVAEKPKTEIEQLKISESIATKIEKLAEFICEESLRCDRLSNSSNWLIFENYNQVFNEIALQMGYDPTQAGNDDWGSIKTINKQLTSFDWYEGKSSDWLQKSRVILRIACSIYEKSVADNELFDQIDFKNLSFEKCRLVAANSLPLEEKKVLWFWMEREKPSCRQIRAEIKSRVDAHNYVEKPSACEVDEDESFDGVERMGKELLRAIATEFISKVKADEILDAENLLREIAIRIQSQEL